MVRKKINSIRLKPINRNNTTASLDWFLLRANPACTFSDPEEIYNPNGLSIQQNAGESATLIATDIKGDGHVGLSTDNARSNSFGPEEDADRVLINASEFNRFRMGITSSLPGGAQVFFWQRGESFVPGFSLVDGIPVSSGQQIVEADLSTNPDWQGEVTRLRLDPVNAQGAEFQLDYVSITPKMLTPRALNADLIINSGNPVFQWDEPLEPEFPVERWEFQIARDFAFTEIATQRRFLTLPRYVHPDESGELDGHYYWRVRSHSANGTHSDWMPPMPVFIRRWNFNTTSDILGPEFGSFTAPNDIVSLSTSNGILTANVGETNGNGNLDPFFYFNNGSALSRCINANVYTRFQMRYRRIGSFSPFPDSMQFFFYDEANNEFSAVNQDFAPLDGQWRILTVNLAQNANWKDYPKLLRLDPSINQPITIEIDWAQLTSAFPTTAPEPEAPPAISQNTWNFY